MKTDGLICIRLFLFALPLPLFAIPFTQKYRFEVYPVNKCPMNRNEFSRASAKRKCLNETRFLCAPNNNLSSLIEFCTDAKKSRFQEGNCVRLEGTGDLNHYNCEERFLYGCPNVSYIDEEIYNYPACLMINQKDHCFSAENQCPNSTANPGSVNDKNLDIHKDETYGVAYFIGVVIALVPVAALILIIAFDIRRNRVLERRKRKYEHLEEQWERAWKNKTKIKVYHSIGILVGCAGAGKTTLLMRLRKRTFKEILNLEIKSTELMDVHVDEFFIDSTSNHLKVQPQQNSSKYSYFACSKNLVCDEEATQTGYKEARPADTREDVNYESQPTTQPQEETTINLTPTKDTSNDDMEESRFSDFVEDKENVPLIKTQNKVHRIFQIKTKDKSLITNVKLENIIEVVRSVEKNDSGNKFVSFFDFGGQFIFYASHQIYMRPEAFYILVVDISKPFDERVHKTESTEEEIEFAYMTYFEYYTFWLNSINAVSKEAPVILVATHADGRSEHDIETYFDEFWKRLGTRKELRAHLSHDRKFAVKFPKSKNEPLEKLDDIESCIVKLVENQQHWGDAVPSSWIFLEYIIKYLQQSFKVIEKEKLWLPNNQVPTEFQMHKDEMNDFLLFLHTVCSVLYFPEKNLEDVVILDVQWFVDAFRYIFTDKTLAKNDDFFGEFTTFRKTGELSDELLKKMWGKESENESFLSYKDYLLRYMQRLGLLAIRSDKDGKLRYFVPCINKRILNLEILGELKQSSIFCFSFSEISTFDFHRLIIRCLEYWNSFVHGQEECIYHNAAFFQHKHHIIAICICGNHIQLQLFVSQKSSVEEKIQSDVRSTVHSILENNFKKEHISVGYKCIKSKFCDKNDMSFFEEDALEDKFCQTCIPSHEIYAEELRWPPKFRKFDRTVSEIHKFRGENARLLNGIHGACREGLVRNFTFFLDKELKDKVDLLSKHDPEGFNALHAAAFGGNTSIFQRLIEKGMDIKQQTTQGQFSVLHIAIQQGNTELCEKILKRDEENRELVNLQNFEGENAIHFAARYGNLKLLSYFHEHKYDMEETNKNKENILHIVCKNKQLDACKLILGKLPDLMETLSEYDWRPIHYCAESGHCEIFKQLSSRGANLEAVSTKKRTILHIACNAGNLNMCQSILEEVPKLISYIDKKGRHAGHFTARSGNVDLLKLLRKKRLDIEAEASDGLTILHLACLEKHVQMCEYILAEFEDMVGKLTDTGLNAAHFTCIVCREEQLDQSMQLRAKKIVSMLEKHDADLLKQVTKNRNSVLTLAHSNKLDMLYNYLMKEFDDLPKLPDTITLEEAAEVRK
ncbi:uncharacterized protein LOC133194994 [Saccostrea echinata]|uniref:uncharacterized protein LOC133194994 n=1 Tax=Saccostrea echinata TaxID=191078 RepID=UPI002A7FC43C|nr:uncharacterized protein LOC133194994 [Saccostrea echinata]